MKNFIFLISFYYLSVFVIAAYILNVRAKNSLAFAPLLENSKKDDNIGSQKGD